MDTNYLTTQVSSIMGQLHGLFDEIGVPNHERETRESELFAALSETLQNQVRLVSQEKKDMAEEAQRIVTTIKQMEASLNDDDSRHRDETDDEELQITYPLTECLQGLKEKQLSVSKRHKERFEQVKKLAQALDSYSSHLEPSFIQINLPPTGSTVSPTFDLSPTYFNALDEEFTRVYEEYTRRVATVKALSENIIQLWAELGTPQAQTDSMIIQYCRDAPEQLGLHEADIARLRAKRDKLSDEKKAREKRLKDLRSSVEALWTRLGIEEYEKKDFLKKNRGCGVREINEFEDELSRLNDLKRQNLGLFIEDARNRLQVLWDGLYFCEDEMLDFTPAFSEVYSDALLDVHEQEIQRLEALTEQRAPVLALIEKHRSLVKDRNDLQASSQDASRLLGRGQKGEKRDPTRLLREEKMRKRIAKDLPKIAVELRKELENWEDEYGRPFLVHGESYLHELEASEPKVAPGPRSKTPAGQPAPPVRTKSAPPLRSGSVRGQPSRSGAKTPVGGGTLKRNPFSESTSRAPGTRSPSKIPSRPPLTNLNHGNNSPERSESVRSTHDYSSMRGKMGPPPARGPPPKMRDLFIPPPQPTPTPMSHFRSESMLSSGSGSVRHVSPEDNFYDAPKVPHHRPQLSYHELKRSTRQVQPDYPVAPPTRQISNVSNSTNSTNLTTSGSENWQTIESESDAEEEDASNAYYAKLRAAREQRFSQDDRSRSAQPSKPPRLLPAMELRPTLRDADGNRIPSGSEANWTDDEGY